MEVLERISWLAPKILTKRDNLLKSNAERMGPEVNYYVQVKTVSLTVYVWKEKRKECQYPSIQVWGW